jgi:murein DD-endopeptidase MepM/ murein hydrolase activator NlpD
MQKIFVSAIGCLLATLPHAVSAQGFTLNRPVEQGALVFGRAAPGTKVTLGGRRLRVTGDGRFVFGVDRDAKQPLKLALEYPDRRRETTYLPVKPRRWRKQFIAGVPPGMVTPPPSLMARLKREYLLVVGVRKADSVEIHWTRKLRWPAHGRISGVFGSQRFYNGKPRSYHSGVDVAVPKGWKVRAPIGGVVSLTHEGLYFAGKTVMVDHGHGVQSSFIHLSRILVRPGERVRQGQVIGLVGSTGRSTGAHLHWSMSWFQTRIDPRRVVGPMPRPKAKARAKAKPRRKKAKRPTDG